VTREECVDLIGEIYRDFLPPGRAITTIGEGTRLFGGDSPLDSTTLVSLLVEVEQQVNETCNTAIAIADDRAMSQSRSPFRTVGSLADYIQMLLSEQSKN
jgi:acyl carrier protein